MNKTISISLAILVFCIGLAGGYFLSTGGKTTHTMEDKEFIEGMIEHHMGAIEMAKDAKSKAKRQEIKDLANQIIAAQEKEIEQMNSWRKDWFNDTSEIKIMGGGHGMNKELGNSDDNYDLRFIEAMIDHHAGAVGMASDVKGTTKRKEISDLANNIIKDQSKEIDMMFKWMSEWYSK